MREEFRKVRLLYKELRKGLHNSQRGLAGESVKNPPFRFTLDGGVIAKKRLHSAHLIILAKDKGHSGCRLSMSPMCSKASAYSSL